MTPGAYIARRREAAHLSLEDVAGAIATEPHIDERGRRAWLAMIEADLSPITWPDMMALKKVVPFSSKVLVQLADRRGDPTLPLPRMCRVCACSELDPCVDADRRHACSWIAEDLCSACPPDTLPTTSIREGASA